jgi:hypothetical protein
LFGGEFAQGINFSMCCSGTTVPALSNDVSLGIKNDAAHLRVHAKVGAVAGKDDGTTHRGLFGLRGV